MGREQTVGPQINFLLPSRDKCSVCPEAFIRIMILRVKKQQVLKNNMMPIKVEVSWFIFSVVYH